MPGNRGPTLRTQWLGQLLGQARRDGHKTLQDAADYLSLRTSTISRYESGHIPAKPQDVESLLNLYEVADVRRRDALVSLSREAWRRDWWDGYHGELTPGVLDHAWLEDRATRIRSFETMGFSGIIQTPEFAEAVIRAYDPEKDDQEIERGIQFRIDRQRIFRKDSPPKLSLILDESLLHRPIGGPQIMADQLRQVMRLAESGVAEVRVLPYAADTPCGARGAFQIFDLPEPFSTVGYVETMAGSVYVESEVVDRFVTTYDRLWKLALRPSESADLIMKAAKETA